MPKDINGVEIRVGDVVERIKHDNSCKGREFLVGETSVVTSILCFGNDYHINTEKCEGNHPEFLKVISSGFSDEIAELDRELFKLELENAMLKNLLRKHGIKFWD